MSQNWMIAAILLPFFGGILIPVLPLRTRKQMMLYIEIIAILTSCIVWGLILHGSTGEVEVVKFVHQLSISLRLDGAGMVFAGLVAFLWPLAVLYSFTYMEHEGREKIFFLFYMTTYAVTLGIAFSSDMLTMYFFYELLTLSTIPLVMHSLNRESILAVRKYMYYSLGGAAFALMGLIFLLVYGSTLTFRMGGILNPEGLADKANLLLLIYVLSFMGFGVKAAIWPLSSWLPQAGVAPTPVTALLHAVAVVKAGAFAIIRLTYYSFGTDFVRGTWAQNVVMAFTMFTIVYGCSRAVKETHIKRRLAYSTVSNLSYILFSVTIMTPLGLIGALSHMIAHAFMKINAFFCAGAFMHQTEKAHVYHMDGIGKKMPIVFGCFTLSGLALMGVPGLAGFISKWNIAMAAGESGNVMAYFGVACLLLSALLTAFYMITVSVRAFFPKKEDELAVDEDVTDPDWKMCLPLIVFSVMIVVLGVYFKPLITFFGKIAAGSI